MHGIKHCRVSLVRPIRVFEHSSHYQSCQVLVVYPTETYKVPTRSFGRLSGFLLMLRDPGIWTDHVAVISTWASLNYLNTKLDWGEPFLMDMVEAMDLPNSR